jgi:hypothetical protein
MRYRRLHRSDLSSENPGSCTVPPLMDDAYRIAPGKGG